MSTWRRKAIELFPDLRNEIQHGEATIYTVFFALLPRCRQAHREGNTAELEKIYGYAEWCLRQKAKDIWNAAGVSFYEHLGDSQETLQEMRNWVRPDVFATVEGLLEERMKAEDFAKLKKQYSWK